MFLTLSKLEFKRGILFYLILYLFFLFWSLSSFGFFFIFSNFSQIFKEFKTNNEVFVIVFSNNKSDINDSIYSNIVKELKIKKFEKITGEEMLKELDLYSEFNRLIDENLKSYLPVGIRFTIESLNQLDEIKKILNSIEKKYDITTYLVFDELYTKIPKLSILKHILILLLLIWNLFYFFFFFFMIKSLNNYLQLYLCTFQILGGSIKKLLLVRLSLIILPFIFIYIIAFYIYQITSNFFVLSFPILKNFPNFNSTLELTMFSFYSLLVCILFPVFTIHLSIKKV